MGTSVCWVPSAVIYFVPDGPFQIEKCPNDNELEAEDFINSKKKKNIADGMDKVYFYEINLSFHLC